MISPTSPLLAAVLLPAAVGAQALAPRPLAAIPDDVAAHERASEFRGHRIAGRELDDNVDKLLEQIEWHEKLASALTAAQQTGKPVVWIQMLGDLDGYT